LSNPRSLPQRLARRVGRRGAALLCLAVVVGLIGYSLVTAPAQVAAQPGLRVLARIPLEAWGWGWVAVAGVCAVGAVRADDRVAYGLAAGLFGLWGGGYLAAWLFYHAERGWVAATVYLAMAGFIALLAGTPERRP
jgi:hypothetical protein